MHIYTAIGPGDLDTLTRTDYVTATAPEVVETRVITYAYDPLYRLTEAEYSNGEHFYCAYDAVGNVTLASEHITTTKTTTYAYNAASQLVTSTVSGESTVWWYTYDANGNLLSDGSRTFQYGYANRLTQVVSGTLTTEFAYNGDGHRVSKTVNGTETRYTLDPVMGLVQVLVETTGGEATMYLYGHDLLAEEGIVWAWHLNDGLGSVRQLTDVAGNVTLVRSYTPFGVEMQSSGSGHSGYGYTGEQEDASTGLVFLRVRYYDPGTGRFTQRDVQPGDYHRSLTLHDYLYVVANPINYTDPSGLCLDADFDGICDGSEPDYRDLTDWLYREMVNNINDLIIRKLRTWNRLAKGGTGIGLIACGVGLVGDQPVIVVGGGIVIVGGTVFEGSALYEFAQQVKNGARWDFKDEIGIKLGPGITLCSSGTCFNDIEYSVPGNIHFAYIGGAAGFFGVEIQAGAAWAEKHDPAHDPASPEYAGPYEGMVDLGPTPWDPSTWNLGDEPTDHEAVTLGIKLWEKYGGSMTRAQFESELAGYIGRLARHAPRTKPVESDVARDWPYPVGYFNNRGNVYNPNQEVP